MKFFKICKDGGEESNSTGLFFVEIKGLFSIVLLRFDPGSREVYHTHAFNAVSWIFGWGLFEWFKGEVEGAEIHSAYLEPGWMPHWTPRERFHQVYNYADHPVWALSFRGPWVARWCEWLPAEDQEIVLTHGRKVIG